MLKSTVLAMSCVVLYCTFLVQNTTSTEPDTSKRSVGSDKRSSAAALPNLESLQVEPSLIVLQTARDPQSVVVTALYSDGSTSDVTSLVELNTMNRRQSFPAETERHKSRFVFPDLRPRPMSP